MTDSNDHEYSAVGVTVPDSLCADESLDEFHSSWPTSDGDTEELHMECETFNEQLRNRRNGMSEATTVIVDREDDSEYNDETNDHTDYEDIEEQMYLYIANSVFAFSLFRDTDWTFRVESNSTDNPDCYICKKENES